MSYKKSRLLGGLKLNICTYCPTSLRVSRRYFPYSDSVTFSNVQVNRVSVKEIVDVCRIPSFNSMRCEALCLYHWPLGGGYAVKVVFRVVGKWRSVVMFGLS